MKELILTIMLGTCCMLALAFYRRRRFDFSIVKTIILTITLTFVGVIGTKILFFIENFELDGLSFYGAVLLVPIMFAPMGLMLKIPYGKLMDFCAIEECIMLCMMKTSCFMTGCCYGREICFSESGKAIVFPSQIVELVVAFIIMCILLRMERNAKYKNCIYPLYMILYGSTRFILNSMRGDLTLYVWILPAGHFWSLVSIAIGIIVLCVIHFRKGKKNDIQ